MTTMPTQPFGPDQVPVSRIALGCMGMAGTWNPAEVGPDNVKRAVAAFEAALDAGITFYDHADIYGGTACESIFKDCLAAVPGSRERIFIATKVGIRSGFYDHSPDYIRRSLDGSLSRLGVEYVDLYQLHRIPKTICLLRAGTPTFHIIIKAYALPRQLSIAQLDRKPTDHLQHLESGL